MVDDSEHSDDDSSVHVIDTPPLQAWSYIV